MTDMMGQGYAGQSTSGFQTYNPGMGSFGIKIRLDPTEILRDLELYLRAAKVIGKEDEKGNYLEETVVVGTPLANEAGVNGIMGYLRTTISPQNVQGNLTWERYDRLIFEIHTDLATIMSAKRREWGINITDYDFILDTIMHSLQMFISRLVENKERESYTESMRTEERSVLKPEKKEGWFSGLFG